MLTSKKSNVFVLRDYAVKRLSQAMIKRLSKELISLEAFDKRSLVHEAEKSYSMARLYLIASLMELEKMSLAQERHIMRQ